MSSERSWSSVNIFGIGDRSTKSVDPAEISAASGNESSTSAPPAIHRDAAKHRVGHAGEEQNIEANIAFAGIVANVNTGSSSANEAAGRPDERRR